MTTENNRFPSYDMTINARITWQAHSISNAGDDGSNRLLPRTQLLADQTITDACSGDILKHHHAALLAEVLVAEGLPLCPACRVRDSRRAGALIDNPEYKKITIERILNECALCDAHGFLITAKKAAGDVSADARQGLHKHTIIDFTFALALPDRHAESLQLHTRSGASRDEGQMLMTRSARSGEYALCIRYQSVRIGVDTYHWQLVVQDEEERLRRHRAILRALRDTLVSPEGARTASMLPHLTGLVGSIAVQSAPGRAPLFSGLSDDFMVQLESMAGDTCRVYPFETASAFYQQMNRLIQFSEPAWSAAWGSRPSPD
jgi:CRISPR-associated autoregulator DevR family